MYVCSSLGLTLVFVRKQSSNMPRVKKIFFMVFVKYREQIMEMELQENEADMKNSIQELFHIQHDIHLVHKRENM